MWQLQLLVARQGALCFRPTHMLGFAPVVSAFFAFSVPQRFALFGAL
jgi:hypothetical protein